MYAPLGPYKNARITSPYGMRTHPITGVTKLHGGVDFGIPTGTPIYSPARGTVRDVYFNQAGGNQLLLDHKNKLRTGFAHLQRVLVNKGDKVKRGQIVAYSGETGQVTGPHLHFTLRNKEGDKIDPLSVRWTRLTNGQIGAIGLTAALVLFTGLVAYEKKIRSNK